MSYFGDGEFRKKRQASDAARKDEKVSHQLQSGYHVHGGSSSELLTVVNHFREQQTIGLTTIDRKVSVLMTKDYSSGCIYWNHFHSVHFNKLANAETFCISSFSL